MKEFIKNIQEYTQSSGAYAGYRAKGAVENTVNKASCPFNTITSWHILSIKAENILLFLQFFFKTY